MRYHTCIPAPPLGSVPAIVKTTGGLESFGAISRTVHWGVYTTDSEVIDESTR